MKRAALILVTCLSMVLTMGMASDGNASATAKEGFVPNAETAIRIAEAILIPIYGTETVKNEKPFTAVLNGNVWTVTGTLPTGSLGGVSTVEIAKDSGCVLRATHGK